MRGNLVIDPPAAGAAVLTQLLRVREFAQACNVKDKTAWSWIAARRIAVVRLGRTVRIPVTEVQRLIAEGTTPAARAR